MEKGAVQFGSIFGVGAGLIKRVQPFCFGVIGFLIHLLVRLMKDEIG